MNKKIAEVITFIRVLYKEPTEVIPLHIPLFRGNEKKYLNDCIDTTFVSSVGKFVTEFEIKMAQYTGANQAVACVNGTNALFLALKLVGVAEGHEVITQPLTFVATANAISYCNAQPVFLDVDLDTMGLSPKSLLNFLESNTHFNTAKNQQINNSSRRPITACVPVHTFGHPCRIDEIVEICGHFHIPVVEDAAESVGSFYKGKHTGTFGKIGILSFNGNKIITTGGGGMLLFNDKELAKHAKHLTTQAKAPHPWEYVHDEIGYNFRMPNINASLGCAQLEQLLGFLTTKRQIAHAYQEFFSKVNIVFQSEPINSSSNYWLNCILLDNKVERDAFLKHTNDNGIKTRPAWQLLNKLAMFNDCKALDLKNSVFLQNCLLNIPSSVTV